MRPAVLSDAPALAALIKEQHARSKYAGRCPIAENALQRVVCGMISAQNQMGPQGSCVFVVEREGRIVAFIAGVVDRIYQIGTKMAANDLFFVNEGGTVGDTLKLVDCYVEWARNIKAVLEIVISWSDTLPGAERLADLYRRKGFSKCGEMWEMRTDAVAEREAA